MLLTNLLFFEQFRATTEHQTVEKSYHETQLLNINADNIDTIAKSENIIKFGDHVYLRSAKGNGSLININQELNDENWSVEIPIKLMKLKDIAKAGLYFWYTDSPVTTGDYLGGNTKFNGFVTGIEFTKDRADLVFSFNYGLDYSQKSFQSLKYDHINPHLIENLESIKMKVIHTEKNFKIEIYDENNNCLSDTFRIHEPLIMNKGNPKKNFAITTKYENCPSNLFFDLADLKLNSRQETENYDVMHILSDYNNYPRNKSDEEIKLTIAELNSFMNYLTVVLGSKNKNRIVDMVLEVKKKLRLIKDSADNILSTVLKDGKSTTSAIEKNLASKVEDLEDTVAMCLSMIDQITKGLKDVKESKANSSFNLSSVIMVIGLVFFVGTAIKRIAEESGLASAIHKKD